MTPAEQGAYDAERHSEPIEFSAWCFENGRKYIGAKNYKEFKKNADDYQAYRDAFFTAKEVKA